LSAATPVAYFFSRWLTAMARTSSGFILNFL
jgi:hypothetical protein